MKKAVWKRAASVLIVKSGDGARTGEEGGGGGDGKGRKDWGRTRVDSDSNRYLFIGEARPCNVSENEGKGEGGEQIPDGSAVLGTHPRGWGVVGNVRSPLLSTFP